MAEAGGGGGGGGATKIGELIVEIAAQITPFNEALDEVENRLRKVNKDIHVRIGISEQQLARLQAAADAMERFATAAQQTGGMERMAGAATTAAPGASVSGKPPRVPAIEVAIKDSTALQKVFRTALENAFKTPISGVQLDLDLEYIKRQLSGLPLQVGTISAEGVQIAGSVTQQAGRPLGLPRTVTDQLGAEETRKAIDAMHTAINVARRAARMEPLSGSSAKEQFQAIVTEFGSDLKAMIKLAPGADIETTRPMVGGRLFDFIQGLGPKVQDQFLEVADRYFSQMGTTAAYQYLRDSGWQPGQMQEGVPATAAQRPPAPGLTSQQQSTLDQMTRAAATAATTAARSQGDVKPAKMYSVEDLDKIVRTAARATTGYLGNAQFTTPISRNPHRLTAKRREALFAAIEARGPIEYIMSEAPGPAMTREELLLEREERPSYEPVSGRARGKKRVVQREGEQGTTRGKLITGRMAPRRPWEEREREFASGRRAQGPLGLGAIGPLESRGGIDITDLLIAGQPGTRAFEGWGMVMKGDQDVARVALSAQEQEALGQGIGPAAGHGRVRRMHPGEVLFELLTARGIPAREAKQIQNFFSKRVFGKPGEDRPAGGGAEGASLTAMMSGAGGGMTSWAREQIRQQKALRDLMKEQVALDKDIAALAGTGVPAEVKSINKRIERRRGKIAELLTNFQYKAVGKITDEGARRRIDLGMEGKEQNPELGFDPLSALRAQTSPIVGPPEAGTPGSWLPHGGFLSTRMSDREKIVTALRMMEDFPNEMADFDEKVAQLRTELFEGTLEGPGPGEGPAAIGSFAGIWTPGTEIHRRARGFINDLRQSVGLARSRKQDIGKMIQGLEREGFPLQAARISELFGMYRSTQDMAMSALESKPQQRGGTEARLIGGPNEGGLEDIEYARRTVAPGEALETGGKTQAGRWAGEVMPGEVWPFQSELDAAEAALAKLTGSKSFSLHDPLARGMDPTKRGRILAERGPQGTHPFRHMGVDLGGAMGVAETQMRSRVARGGMQRGFGAGSDIEFGWESTGALSDLGISANADIALGLFTRQALGEDPEFVAQAEQARRLARRAHLLRLFQSQAQLRGPYNRKKQMVQATNYQTGEPLWSLLEGPVMAGQEFPMREPVMVDMSGPNPMTGDDMARYLAEQGGIVQGGRPATPMEMAQAARMRAAGYEGIPNMRLYDEAGKNVERPPAGTLRMPPPRAAIAAAGGAAGGGVAGGAAGGGPAGPMQGGIVPVWIMGQSGAALRVVGGGGGGRRAAADDEEPTPKRTRTPKTQAGPAVTVTEEGPIPAGQALIPFPGGRRGAAAARAAAAAGGFAYEEPMIAGPEGIRVQGESVAEKQRRKEAEAAAAQARKDAADAAAATAKRARGPTARELNLALARAGFSEREIEASNIRAQFLTGPDQSEAIIAARQRAREAQARLPSRALSTSIVQIAQRMFGGREEPEQNIIRLQRLTGQLGQFEARGLATRRARAADFLELRTRRAQAAELRGRGEAVPDELTDRMEELTQGVKSHTESLKKNEENVKKVSDKIVKLSDSAVTAGDVFRNLAAGFVGGIAGGLVTAGVSAFVSAAQEIGTLVKQAIDPAIEAGVGYLNTTQRVSSALADQVLANQGATSQTVALAAAQAGLTDSTYGVIGPQLEQAAMVEAANKQTQQQIELLRAGGNLGGREIPRGLFRSTGGFADTGLLGGTIFGPPSTPSSMENFLKRFEGAGFNVGPPGGVPSYSADLLTDFGIAMNKIFSGQGLDMGTEVADRAVAELNSQFAKIGSAYTVGLDATADQAAALEQTLIDLGIDQGKRDQFKGLGIAFHDATGSVVTDIDSLTAAMLDLDTAALKVDPELFTRNYLMGGRGPLRIQLEQQQAMADLARQAAGAGRYVARLAQPPLPFGAGIPTTGAFGEAYGAMRPSADVAAFFMDQFVAQDRANFEMLISKLDAGDQAQARHLQGLVTVSGKMVTGIQTQAREIQMGAMQRQYGQSRTVAQRQLADLLGLSGRGPTQGVSASNVGLMQAENRQLSRDMQQLQFRMQERSLNYQIALAGFMGPGATGEEIADRRRIAEKEAADQRTLLEGSRTIADNEYKIQTEEIKRATDDAAFALDDLTKSWAEQAQLQALGELSQKWQDTGNRAAEELNSFVGQAAEYDGTMVTVAGQLRAMGATTDELGEHFENLMRWIDESMEADETPDFVPPEPTEADRYGTGYGPGSGQLSPSQRTPGPYGGFSPDSPYYGVNWEQWSPTTTTSWRNKLNSMDIAGGGTALMPYGSGKTSAVTVNIDATGWLDKPALTRAVIDELNRQMSLRGG